MPRPDSSRVIPSTPVEASTPDRTGEPDNRGVYELLSQIQEKVARSDADPSSQAQTVAERLLWDCAIPDRPSVNELHSAEASIWTWTFKSLASVSLKSDRHPIPLCRIGPTAGRQYSSIRFYLATEPDNRGKPFPPSFRYLYPVGPSKEFLPTSIRLQPSGPAPSPQDLDVLVDDLIRLRCVELNRPILFVLSPKNVGTHPASDLIHSSVMYLDRVPLSDAIGKNHCWLDLPLRFGRYGSGKISIDVPGTHQPGDYSARVRPGPTGEVLVDDPTLGRFEMDVNQLSAISKTTELVIRSVRHCYNARVLTRMTRDLYGNGTGNVSECEQVDGCLDPLREPILRICETLSMSSDETQTVEALKEPLQSIYDAISPRQDQVKMIEGLERALQTVYDAILSTRKEGHLYARAKMPGSGGLEFVCGEGKEELLRKHPAFRPLGMRHTGIVATTKAPLIVHDDTDPATRFAPVHMFVKSEEVSLALIPVIDDTDSQLHGVLCFSSSQPFAFAQHQALLSSASKLLAPLLKAWILDRHRTARKDALAFLPRFHHLEGEPDRAAIARLLSVLTSHNGPFEFHRAVYFRCFPDTDTLCPVLAIGPATEAEYKALCEKKPEELEAHYSWQALQRNISTRFGKEYLQTPLQLACVGADAPDRDLPEHVGDTSGESDTRALRIESLPRAHPLRLARTTGIDSFSPGSTVRFTDFPCDGLSFLWGPGVSQGSECVAFPLSRGGKTFAVVYADDTPWEATKPSSLLVSRASELVSFLLEWRQSEEDGSASLERSLSFSAGQEPSRDFIRLRILPAGHSPRQDLSSLRIQKEDHSEPHPSVISETAMVEDASSIGPALLQKSLNLETLTILDTSGSLGRTPTGAFHGHLEWFRGEGSQGARELPPARSPRLWMAVEKVSKGEYVLVARPIAEDRVSQYSAQLVEQSCLAFFRRRHLEELSPHKAHDWVERVLDDMDLSVGFMERELAQPCFSRGVLLAADRELTELLPPEERKRIRVDVASAAPLKEGTAYASCTSAAHLRAILFAAARLLATDPALRVELCLTPGLRSPRRENLKLMLGSDFSLNSVPRAFRQLSDIFRLIPTGRYRGIEQTACFRFTWPIVECDVRALALQIQEQLDATQGNTIARAPDCIHEHYVTHRRNMTYAYRLGFIHLLRAFDASSDPGVLRARLESAMAELEEGVVCASQRLDTRAQLSDRIAGIRRQRRIICVEDLQVPGLDHDFVLVRPLSIVLERSMERDPETRKRNLFIASVPSFGPHARAAGSSPHEAIAGLQAIIVTMAEWSFASPDQGLSGFTTRIETGIRKFIRKRGHR